METGLGCHSPKVLPGSKRAQSSEKIRVVSETTGREMMYFDNVIFNDECSVQLDCHGRLCFWKRNQPRKMKPRPKHPIKVHIWGGITI